MEDFYKEIIKNENLFFRGVELGASISDVEVVEGSNYMKKSGSNPSLYYYWDTGQIENIDLYFGLDDDEKVNRVKLMFYTEPDFYHEKITGEDFTSFEQKFYQKNIEEALAIPNSLLNRIIPMFTKNLGTPEEKHKDEVFNKDYQNFQRWIWYKNYSNKSLRLSLTSYLDDSDGRTVKWVFSLILSENTKP